MGKRPNLVFILEDHQAYFGHGMYSGGREPERPCFKAFASKGVEFSNARCVTPMCGPARRTFLTGLYPHTHKQIHNENDPPYEDPLSLDLLDDAGYDVFYYGKWHAGPGCAADHHAKGFSMPSYGNPYLSQTYHDYLKRKGLPEARHFVECAFMSDSYLQQHYFPGLEAGKEYQCRTGWCGEHAVGITLTPKETHESFFLANLACDRLEEIARHPSGHPFCLQVHFWGPHQPFFPTREFAALYDPKEIGEYPSFGGDLKDQPEVFKDELSRPLTEDGKKIRIPSVLPWSDWQKILARCYGHISMVDAAGGLVVKKAKELGLDDNTLFVWTTDHGDALASHGGHFDKDSHMSEEVMRVPLAMSWNGRIPAGLHDDHLVFTCDIPTTMMDAAETPFPKTDGRSLLNLVDGKPWRDSLLCESYGHGYGVTIISRMVVKGKYKYVVTEHDLEQLYDLMDDPWELHNLAVSPQSKPILIAMREEMRRLQKTAHDPVELDQLLQTVTRRW